MVFGGFVEGGTFEFDAQLDSVDSPHGNSSPASSLFTFNPNRRKGKQSKTMEETDDSVYFLSLNTDTWIWSKPVVHGTIDMKPIAR
jgi:hypothetical protein